MKFNIQIDNRERERAERIRKRLEGEYSYKCSIEQLPVGDYIFNNQVVFEYKTVADMIGSIKSRRVHNQAIRQSEEYPYHFVIIEGDDTHLSENSKRLHLMGVTFNNRMYYGEIARLNTFTTVLNASTEKKAVDLMIMQATKCLDNKTLSKELTVKKANPAYNFLKTSIQGIGDKTTETITSKLKLKSLKDLLTLTKDDLTNIHGVGEKTAENIIRAIQGDQ